ncbi:MAG: histidine--tRNA ligase [Candidatus Uhrbacteria bacterium]|nr:histidine--tRNA ligase [Patescibacteria group bacterium]MBU1907374.1 histidine--tRNA ligase [Patescibacteria group bacterium]
MPKKAEDKKTKEETEDKQEEKPKKRIKTPELLRGFRDLLPEEQPYWDFLRSTVRGIADSYSFQRLVTPVIEDKDLFIRTVGKQTDIVEKEMYQFETPGGEKVALRPEMTASFARAYINHGMLDRPQPVKLWDMGPLFRHDRPQAGRYRQFNQFNFEVFGSEEPIIDAQLMVLLHSIFKELGLDVVMQVNSIGTPQTRQEYKVELVAYYRSNRARICDECKRRLQKNPLRLLDCKEEGCQEVRAEAPMIVDWLDEDSKNHFMQVLEFLDEIEVPYVLNPHLVRGLDYYNRTVFEVYLAKEDNGRSQSALGGGGRYDGLIELLGGREGTPGCGFAVGMERVVAALREQEVSIPVRRPDIFFAQLGDAARRRGLKIFEDFRQAGIHVSEAFGKGALKSQLDLANKLEVAYTIILGQKEVLDDTIIIRDMDSGSQEIIDAKKVVEILKKKLAETGDKPIMPPLDTETDLS